MVQIADKEKKALIILFKDFSSYYNANTVSKKIGISRVGAMKMLKRLENKGILNSEKVGKSVIYKPNMEDDYIRDLITFLLSDEANSFQRWKKEFKEVFKNDRVIIIYGSTLIDYSKARDIDIMIIRKKGESGNLHKLIAERQKFLTKKIHMIDLTHAEFIKNLRKKQRTIIDIVKNAVVLYGQNKYVELIKNVTSI